MSVDKSWDRGAGLSLSAARIQWGMQGTDTEENRAAVPTLVYGHLELTIHKPPDQKEQGEERTGRRLSRVREGPYRQENHFIKFIDESESSQ
ncbi:hypothetical protein Y032_0013g2146 [Ancylostoma ceylanicum]|uniref:Uncharacterized protein n=1 Tax=Ancylostoma ceylanicum TaxID=53326 RepID=A0A016VCT0_9BILA|nr:hypothetical protein Y032_0013g2146 [Ancylostoma ceylanicum]